MAGVRVKVCLPAEASDDIEAALAHALEPFGPGGGLGSGFLWEWWAVRGGSDASGFRIAPGREGDARLVHDAPHYTGEPLPSRPGWCAGGPRELLDLTTAREAARAFAAADWDLWHKLAPDYPAMLPRSVFWARHLADPEGYSRFQVLADHREQPLMRAFTAERLPGDRHGDPLMALICDENALTAFELDRDRYVRRLVAQALGAYDLLTLDGWWIEYPAWKTHGSCVAAENCAHSPEGYDPEDGLVGYLDGLPAQTLIVSLKCHV